MSSSKQTRANRRNARKSTGPVTPQGKATVAQNARQHGLSGSFTILAHENGTEFQELLKEYNAEFAPQSAHEKFLIEEMAQARWTLARARRIEVHLLDQLAGSDPKDAPDACIAAALNAKSHSALATLQRYAITADRAYFRAYRVLSQDRNAALRNKANQAQAFLQDRIKKTSQSPPFDPTRWDSPPDPSIFTGPPDLSGSPRTIPGNSA